MAAAGRRRAQGRVCGEIMEGCEGQNKEFNVWQAAAPAWGTSGHPATLSRAFSEGAFKRSKDLAAIRMAGVCCSHRIGAHLWCSGKRHSEMQRPQAFPGLEQNECPFFCGSTLGWPGRRSAQNQSPTRRRAEWRCLCSAYSRFSQLQFLPASLGELG